MFRNVYLSNHKTIWRKGKILKGLLFIALIIFISILLASKKIILRIRIREIIKKYSDTIRFLKNGTFKKHELVKSLKEKVFAELSYKKFPVDRRKLNKIVEQEIMNVLKGWSGKLRVYFVVIGSIMCVYLIAKFTLTEISSGSKVTSAMNKVDSVIRQSNTSKSAIKSSKSEPENKGTIEKEAKKDKNEEYFISGVKLMNNRENPEAIKQFERVSKNSVRFEEAQKYILTLKRNQFIETCKDISYKELKKAPEDYRGHNIHFFGRIYNIQEINGKTILSLSTSNDNGDYLGDEAFILFPAKTSLIEGDYIDIYGEMKGNFSENQQFISNYINGKQYRIYYDQRTFFEQAPVLDTKVIIDSKGKIISK